MTLLGDAAHPMFPFYAQGAAQAIEDAAALAQCLADQPDQAELALQRYEEVRRPRATKIQQLSHGRKHINHLPDGDEQRARDAALADGDPLADSAWLYGYDAELQAARPVSSGSR
jgi:salicylate hydroxylase